MLILFNQCFVFPFDHSTSMWKYFIFQITWDNMKTLNNPGSKGPSHLCAPKLQTMCSHMEVAVKHQSGWPGAMSHFQNVTKIELKHNF